MLVIYFENLGKNQKICLPVEVFKSYAVTLQKPSPIVIYDYYHTDRKAISYYQIDSKFCDICELDEQCIKTCK